MWFGPCQPLYAADWRGPSWIRAAWQKTSADAATCFRQIRSPTFRPAALGSGRGCNEYQPVHTTKKNHFTPTTGANLRTRSGLWGGGGDWWLAIVGCGVGVWRVEGCVVGVVICVVCVCFVWVGGGVRPQPCL